MSESNSIAWICQQDGVKCIFSSDAEYHLRQGHTLKREFNGYTETLIPLESKKDKTKIG